MKKSKVIVEMDIVSSNATPVWELDDADIDVLRRKLSWDIPQVMGDAPQLSECIGFQIVNFGDSRLPEMIYCPTGIQPTMEIENKGKIEYYTDANSINIWLKEKAKENGLEKYFGSFATF